MIKPLQIRSAVFGTGMPKICIPLTSSGKRDLADEARALLSASPDLGEWRVDYFEQSDSLIEGRMMLSALRDILKDIPLLFTFRTNDEGGQKRISPEDYHLLCRTACKSGCIDLLDAELSQGDAPVNSLLLNAHACGVRVVVSSHDFTTTPPKEALIEKLTHMQRLGAYMPKIAVMPKSRLDTLTLLSATLEMREKFADRPFITMAMGEYGAFSRVCGEFFGSALTFATALNASAPGQLEAARVRRILEALNGI